MPEYLSTSAFVDYINYRTQRKAEIRAAIYSQAAQTPALIQAQWRILQTQMESAAAAEKQIDDYRREMESGRLTVLDAAKRAEGSVNTALVNAQGSIAVAKTNADADREAAMIKARSETIPDSLDRIQSGATEGSSGRFSQMSTTARNLTGRSAADVEAGLGTELDRLYVPSAASQTTTLGKTTFLADTADKVRQAAQVAGLSAADAQTVTESLMADKFGATPGSYTGNAVSSARSAEQSKIESGLGASSRGGGGGNYGVGQPGYSNTPSRAEQAGVESPEAFEQLARRAAYNRIGLESPQYLQGRSLEQLAGDPQFEALVVETRDTAPITDIQSYASPRLMDLFLRQQDDRAAIARSKAELERMQKDLPDVRDLEDRATLAFVDLYGSPGARKALSEARTGAERAQVLDQVTTARAIQDAGPDAKPEDIAALQKKYFTEATTPAPATGATRKAMRGLSDADQAAYQADLGAQESARDRWMRLATQPDVSVSQSVDPATMDVLKSSGFKSTADTTGDLYGNIGGRTVRVGEAQADVVPDTGRTQAPWIDPTLPNPGAPTPKVALKDLDFSQPSDAELSNDFQFQSTDPADIIQTPDAPVLVKPGIKKLVTEDKDLAWYTRRPKEQDPVLEIPVLLSNGRSADDLSSSDKARLTDAINRLNEDIAETQSIYDSEPKPNERKALAAVHLLELSKVSDLVNRATTPPVSAKDAEQRKMLSSAAAGATMAKKAVSGSVIEDPARYLKETFGKNELKPLDLVTVKELARSQYAPQGPELNTQLMRIAGDRWARAEVRDQMRALYVALVESKKAVEG
jgi:hypothetical protein